MTNMLVNLLSLLKAQSDLFQNKHWVVHGNSYYGDHLLFERLYGELQDEIDQLAEKIVSYFDEGAVDPCLLASKKLKWLFRWSKCANPALQSEFDFQNYVQEVYTTLSDQDLLTLGLDDFLMSMANRHEGALYLLGQRSKVAFNSLEKSWGGYSTFTPMRRGEEDEEEFHPCQCGGECQCGGTCKKAKKLVEKWASTAEKYFFDSPVKRVIRDFAKSKNPPSPVEIKEQEPGGEEFSTLTRFVVDTSQKTKDKLKPLKKHPVL